MLGSVSVSRISTTLNEQGNHKRLGDNRLVEQTITLNNNELS
jgi:hypothetical protein|tara:strand:+ start:38 stop:163 length:126 start_codon:yes stop_codon:yes gene_type:complete